MSESPDSIHTKRERKSCVTHFKVLYLPDLRDQNGNVKNRKLVMWSKIFLFSKRIMEIDQLAFAWSCRKLGRRCNFSLCEYNNLYVDNPLCPRNVRGTIAQVWL